MAGFDVTDANGQYTGLRPGLRMTAGRQGRQQTHFRPPRARRNAAGGGQAAAAQAGGVQGGAALAAPPPANTVQDGEAQGEEGVDGDDAEIDPANEARSPGREDRDGGAESSHKGQDAGPNNAPDEDPMGQPTPDARQQPTADPALAEDNGIDPTRPEVSVMAGAQGPARSSASTPASTGLAHGPGRRQEPSDDHYSPAEAGAEGWAIRDPPAQSAQGGADASDEAAPGPQAPDASDRSTGMGSSRRKRKHSNESANGQRAVKRSKNGRDAPPPPVQEDGPDFGGLATPRFVPINAAAPPTHDDGQDHSVVGQESPANEEEDDQYTGAFDDQQEDTTVDDQTSDANDEDAMRRDIEMLEGELAHERLLAEDALPLVYFTRMVTRVEAFEHRTPGEWRSMYCRIKWDRFLPTIVDPTRRARLNGIFTAMRQLEAEGEDPKTPATFLHSKSWQNVEDLYAGNPDMQQLIRDLELAMWNNVINGELDRPENAREYLQFQAWADHIANQTAMKWRDYFRVTRPIMWRHVVRREIQVPLAPRIYFHREDWVKEADATVDEKQNRAVHRIESNMKKLVRETGNLPYGPATYFMDDYWDQEAAVVAEGQRREVRALQQRMKENVLSHRLQPYNIQIARCLADWDVLEDDINRALGDHADKSAFKKAYKIVRSELREDLNAIIWVPDVTAVPVGQLCGFIEDHAIKQRMSNIRNAWKQLIDGENSSRARARLLKEQAEMEGNFASSPGTNPLYRYGNKPASKEETTRQLHFDNPSIPGVWHYDGKLGSGSFGFVSLWTKLDANGRISGRLAVKDTYGVWNRSKNWEGDINARIPTEWDLMVKLAALPGSESVVKVVGSSRAYPDLQMYRIYMEFCQQGTLEDLIETYFKNCRNAIQDETGAPLNYRIPRRMLWSIFSTLSTALCLLQNARLPTDPIRAPWPTGPWLHRDLKPLNILLTTPSPTTWPEILTTKVADFGLATKSSLESSRKTDVGTRGYRAPESISIPAGGAPVDAVDVRETRPESDVWAVGRIMLSLMNLDVHDAVLAKEFKMESEGVRPAYKDGVEGFYGEKLVGLVNRCLEKRPGGRIQAADLWGEIEKVVGDGENPMRLWPRQDGEVLWMMEKNYTKWAR